MKRAESLWAASQPMIAFLRTDRVFDGQQVFIIRLHAKLYCVFCDC